MQTGSEQLRRQQEILAVKGFYKGALDGIWGPKTIEAKISWEMHPSFTPGIPNRGLPFGDKGPYPKGLLRNRVDGMFTCPELDMRKSQEEKSKVTIEVKSKTASAHATPGADTSTPADPGLPDDKDK